MKKRNFGAEFKREFAQLVVDQYYTVADVAKAMNIGLSTMTRWVKQLQGERVGKAPEASPITPEQIEIRELKKKIQRIEIEKEILKEYCALDVRPPEQFTLIRKLRARYLVAILCHVFGVHRNSYKYWKCRSVQPDKKHIELRNQVQELHHLSHGSAGARSIAMMATHKGFLMGRWLAARLMKELGLVSCQQPRRRYKRGGQEHVVIPNHLERQFAVTEPNQMWCGDVTYI